MPQSPFSTVTRHLHRQNITTFGSLVLVLALASLLVLGTQREVEQERDRLSTDFDYRVDYLQEQEQFLQQLHDRNAQQTGLPPPLPSDVRQPFDHLPGQGAAGDEAYQAVGRYLSRQYAAFWAFSPFPAAPLLVVNAADGSAISVPGQQGGSSTTAAWLAQARDQALQHGPDLPMTEVSDQEDAPAITPVRWFALPGQPEQLVGLAHAGFRRGRVATITDDASKVYMGVVADSRQHATTDLRRAPLQHALWLYRNDQLLLGDATRAPTLERDGFHLRASGLVLALHDRSGQWQGRYQISYATFFAANRWLLLVAGALLVMAGVASAAYVRWYRRQVIEPARQAQRGIVESEAFNRTLVETTPVALCLLSQPDGEVLFASPLAQQWLGLQVGPPLQGQRTDLQLLHAALASTQPGVIEQIDLDDGRSLHLDYAPTRYQRQPVLLCAFTDISSHTELQRALAQARVAADNANAAKSTFLATMSHEIRTPLYGLIGTLELLALTSLDERQQQHLARLQDASQQLLQQISDVLDISKIEAGQLRVVKAAFSPQKLVQQVTAGYAGMAASQGLLLFCTSDPEVPAQVLGDAMRIRQVLSNLISNAIKFTASGHVIVRLRTLERSAGRSRLAFEVTDSGSGIAADTFDQLFTPFSALAQNLHSVRGTGLGLSICQRLAGLMDGSIEVASQLGVGSSFWLQLPLEDAPADPEQPAHPQLGGLRVLLRTPHPELSRHLAHWLAQWGATVEQQALADALPADQERVLLDVQTPSAAPGNWRGRYVALAPREGEATDPHVDAHDVEAIARSLQRLQRPDSRATPAAPSRPAAPLDMDVLVAEDNPINQATLYDQLCLLGCRVTVASDGEQALAQWQIRRYDVVLTDINMPNMNGYELARALRAQGVTCGIIGVTANAMRDEEQRCLESGMDAWLVKPIQMARLRELLCHWQPAPASDPDASIEPASRTVPLLGEDAAPQVPARYRELFQTNMRLDIEAFCEALSQCDTKRLKQRLHRMRGALVTVGLVTAAEALQQAENHLAEQEWGDPLAAELADLCAALVDLVEAV